MSRKLPIAETALEAILFAMRQTLPTLRVAWLPGLVTIALFGLGIYLFSMAFPGLFDGLIAAGEAAEAQGTLAEDQVLEIIRSHIDGVQPLFAGLGGLALLAAWAAILPISVLIYRVAAGDVAMPGGIFYWRWGAHETWFLVTYVVYVILLQVVTGAIGLGGEWAIQHFAQSGDVTLRWVPMIVGPVTLVVTLWVVLRTILIPAAAAVEGKMNVVSATLATGGNVFRLLGSLILLCLLLVVSLLAFGILMFILSLLLGTIDMAVGDETAGGLILSIVSAVLLVGLSVYAYIAVQLVSLGWAGMAWAALRKDNVKPCGDGAPGEGAVCEV